MGEASPFVSRYWELSSEWKDKPRFCWSKSELNAAHRFVYDGIISDMEDPFLKFGVDMVRFGNFRLPFEHVVLEFCLSGNPPMRHMTFCSQHVVTPEWLIEQEIEQEPDITPILIKLCHYMRGDDGWVPVPPVYIGTGEKRDPPFMVYFNGIYDEPHDVASIVIHSCLIFLMMQASDSFKMTKVVPPSKLQAARARNNKPPLFEFKLVELDTSKEKIIPVSPCLVGSIKDGLTDKAYLVS